VKNWARASWDSLLREEGLGSGSGLSFGLDFERGGEGEGANSMLVVQPIVGCWLGS